MYIYGIHRFFFLLSLIIIIIIVIMYSMVSLLNLHLCPLEHRIGYCERATYTQPNSGVSFSFLAMSINNRFVWLCMALLSCCRQQQQQQPEKEYAHILLCVFYNVIKFKINSQCHNLTCVAYIVIESLHSDDERCECNYNTDHQSVCDHFRFCSAESAHLFHQTFETFNRFQIFSEIKYWPSYV